MSKDYYRWADIILEYLENVLIKKFSRLKSLLPLDEINPMNAVEETYTDILNLVREAFLLLANETARSLSFAADMESLSAQWVDEMLEGYNPTSKVVFNNEFTRKRDRLVESLLASNKNPEEVDAAKKSLMLMLNTYAILIADASVLEVYTRDGAKEGTARDDITVRWRAELDNKTCHICRNLNGLKFQLRNLPPKPHFNCRCWYERVKR